MLGTAWDTFAIAEEDAGLRRVTAEWSAMAAEQGFQFYLARARYCTGWLAARDGDAAAGARMVDGAARELAEAGVILDAPQVYWMLADAWAAASDTAAALAAIEQGLAIAEASNGIWWNSELYLTRARLRIDDPDAAERDFLGALQAARGMSARARELKAATAYGEFLVARGREQEAHALVAPIHAWFAEGHDRPAHRAATELLARIAPGA